MLRIATDVGGSAHEVIWTDEGEVQGDEAALEMIAAASDVEVMVTPTGPLVPVSIEDPRSILAFFEETGHVEWEGEMPPWPYALDEDDAPRRAIF